MCYCSPQHEPPLSVPQPAWENTSPRPAEENSMLTSPYLYIIILVWIVQTIAPIHVPLPLFLKLFLEEQDLTVHVAMDISGSVDYGDPSKAKFIKKVGTAEFDTIHRSYTIPPPGGESIKDVEKRVMPFVKDLVKFMKKNKVNVAISAHGNSMRPFRRYFERLSIKQMMELENPWDKHFEYNIKCGK